MSRAPLAGAKAFTFFDTFKHWRQTPLEVYPCRMHSEIAASVFLWSEHDKHRSTNLFTMKIPWLECLECKENAVVQSIGEPPDMKVAVLLRGPACSHQEAIRGVCLQECLFYKHEYNVHPCLIWKWQCSSEAWAVDTEEHGVLSSGKTKQLAGANQV